MLNFVAASIFRSLPLSRVRQPKGEARTFKPRLRSDAARRLLTDSAKPRLDTAKPWVNLFAHATFYAFWMDYEDVEDAWTSHGEPRALKFRLDPKNDSINLLGPTWCYSTASQNTHASLFS